MSFDIHQFDKANWYDFDNWEEALDNYIGTLMEQFLTSPEGEALREEFPDAGFWPSQMIHYGFTYLGVALPKLREDDVDQIITGIFPEKISILSPEDLNGAIEELVAFWQYLKREYRLRQADAILKFLEEVTPDFPDMMTDPANFGMAKSFMMMGQQAGFDMTDPKGIDAFMDFYNASMIAKGSGIDIPPEKDIEKLAERYPGIPGSTKLVMQVPDEAGSKKKAGKSKRKQKRKAASAMRRRNRKK